MNNIERQLMLMDQIIRMKVNGLMVNRRVLADIYFQTDQCMKEKF